MSNYIEYTKIRPTRYVPITSRYSRSTVVYYTENKILSFSTYKKTNVPISQNDKYYVVTSGTEYRPDVVSQNAYGTPDFWWKILEANNIKDIYDFKAGLNIRIPNSIFG